MILEKIKGGTYRVDAESVQGDMLHEAIHTFVYVDDKQLGLVELLRCPAPGILEIVVGCSPDGSPMPDYGDESFPDIRILDGKAIRLGISSFPDTVDSDHLAWSGQVSVYYEAGPRSEVFGRQVIRAVIHKEP